jgi:hypothetical protein
MIMHQMRERGEYLALGQVTSGTKDHYIAGFGLMTILPDSMLFQLASRLRTFYHKTAPRQKIAAFSDYYMYVLFNA